ncbi:copper amine oxidase N-terminal domain-containing protein [Paenibacillus sp. LHD-38]|uniref:copper amine oxidase N-terminal domain-containing protein n=1 Tax=Paenibacillus sp. LHD-38 TaxID=3072143 RepID=UPI00280C85D1|nr:copper amine oxidase N-terminal domain-containing protein [Paenibacillus sp. LHD-38]MDQ8738069.1 copper amine oxidase N-terminal domain-containing protein [Paenibacillus sp. LHD-38]
MKSLKWLLFICLFFTLAPQVEASQTGNITPKLTLYLNGTKVAVTPFLKDGTVFIPIRAAMEYLHAKVDFSEKKIIIDRADAQIIMEPGKTLVTINGESVMVTTPPIIVKGSTYVPLRFVGNALGYEVLYQPASKKVLLSTAGNQAVIYGYVENIDGQAVQQGTLLIEDVADQVTYEAPIRNGFYRLNTAPKTYRFKGYWDSYSGRSQTVNVQEPFELSSGQTVFYKLTPSQLGFKITLLDPAGNPIAKTAVSFNSSHGAIYVNIRNGIGYLGFLEPGNCNFNDADIKDEDKTAYDIYHSFTIDESGNASSLNILAHPPNVKGQILGESKAGYGNLDICSAEDDDCSVQAAPGGAFSFYLPDGNYKWSSYYDSTIRQHFEVNLAFSVSSGQTQRICNGLSQLLIFKAL